MAEALTDLFTWLETLSPWLVYVSILVIAYGENLIPPIPGDLVVVFGGYLAAVDRVDLVTVVALATVGGAAGFMTMFYVGRSLGDALLDPGRYRWLPKKRLRKGLQWVQRWRKGIIAANRFLSGTRSVISLASGMAEIRARTALVLCTLSALVWTGLIGIIGYLVGDNWRVVGDYLSAYGQFILALIVAIVLFQVIRYWRNERADASKGETSENRPM
jgi:membrane protein DedA with SNARE-associated domain